MKGIKNIKHGFTLLELLVVVLIIGILASIALPQYQNSVIKANFAEAYIKLKAMAQLEELCRLQNGTQSSCEDQSLKEQINTEFNGCKELSEVGGCVDFDWDKNKFHYIRSGVSSDHILASAQYIKEEVCLCITKDYKFVLTQKDEADCSNNAATKDYSKILGIPDVTDDDYGCNCC